MGTLAKATQLTQGSITQSIDKLEKEGYLNRVRSTTVAGLFTLSLPKKQNS